MKLTNKNLCNAASVIRQLERKVNISFMKIPPFDDKAPFAAEEGKQNRQNNIVRDQNTVCHCFSCMFLLCFFSFLCLPLTLAS